MKVHERFPIPTDVVFYKEEYKQIRKKRKPDHLNSFTKFRAHRLNKIFLKRKELYVRPENISPDHEFLKDKIFGDH